MSCDQCDQTFESEDFEGWFTQMKAHYMADHLAIMMEMKAKYTKEDGERWINDAKARFEAL